MLELFLDIDKTGRSEDTLRKRARIRIKCTGVRDGNKRYINPDCVTYNEVEEQLIAIEKQIKKVRKKAAKDMANVVGAQS